MTTACAGADVTKTKPSKKAKAKAKAGHNPKAVWDLRKAKLSTLEKAPFPLVDRAETKKVVEAVLLAKVAWTNYMFGPLTLTVTCYVMLLVLLRLGRSLRFR